MCLAIQTKKKQVLTTTKNGNISELDIQNQYITIFDHKISKIKSTIILHSV